MTIGFDGDNNIQFTDMTIKYVANTTESNPNVTDTGNDTNTNIIGIDGQGKWMIIGTNDGISQTLTNKTITPRSISGQKNKKNPHHWWCHICDCWNRCMIADHQQTWQWVQLPMA